ncbi:hypothetical protein WA158_004317 [Blastocystis sp. Blastoise]
MTVWLTADASVSICMNSLVDFIKNIRVEKNSIELPYQRLLQCFDHLDMELGIAQKTINSLSKDVSVLQSSQVSYEKELSEVIESIQETHKSIDSMSGQLIEDNEIESLSIQVNKKESREKLQNNIHKTNNLIKEIEQKIDLIKQSIQKKNEQLTQILSLFSGETEQNVDEDIDSGEE